MTDHATLTSILSDFCTGTPHVQHASLVSPDGLRLASTMTDTDQADPIAAAVSGLISISGGGSSPRPAAACARCWSSTTRACSSR